MRRSLPPEILDLIVDRLRDEPTALKMCCLVSKLWVLRSRRNLFAHVNFDTHGSPIESWMKAFPNPSNSPAHHTQTLTTRGLQLVTAAGTDVGPWIRAFHSVVHLHVYTFGSAESWGDDYQDSLIPFHGLSPAVRSLHLYSISTPPSRIFGLLCSFPLLETFTSHASGGGNRADEWTAPLASPRLTGSLELCSIGEGIAATIRRLLELPNGLRFTNIAVLCFSMEDFESTMDLVLGCSDTLESLSILGHLEAGSLLIPILDRCLTVILDASAMPSLNLSTIKGLKHLVFHSTRPNMQWITTALQTVQSKDLRQITLRPPGNSFINAIEEVVRRQWLDLDRLLVHLLASRSIRPEVTYIVKAGEKDFRDHAPSLLPELTRRGLVDLIEYDP